MPRLRTISRLVLEAPGINLVRGCAQNAQKVPFAEQRAAATDFTTSVYAAREKSLSYLHSACVGHMGGNGHNVSTRNLPHARTSEARRSCLLKRLGFPFSRAQREKTYRVKVTLLLLDAPIGIRVGVGTFVNGGL